MATADDIAEGFLRYDELQKLRIVSSRSDLHDKQRNLGFPLPIKPGRKVALFLRSEVMSGYWGWSPSVTPNTNTVTPANSLKRRQRLKATPSVTLT